MLLTTVCRASQMSATRMRGSEHSCVQCYDTTMVIRSQLMLLATVVAQSDSATAARILDHGLQMVECMWRSSGQSHACDQLAIVLTNRVALYAHPCAQVASSIDWWSNHERLAAARSLLWPGTLVVVMAIIPRVKLRVVAMIKLHSRANACGTAAVLAMTLAHGAV